MAQKEYNIIGVLYYVSVDGREFSKTGSVSDTTAFSFAPEVSGSYDILIMQINNEKTWIAVISGAGQLNSDNLSTYILNAIITKAEFIALTHYIDTYYLLNKQVVD